MVAPFPIRPARLADVPAIHAIERDAFSDPWSPRDFRDCLESELPFLVATSDGGVAGYIVGLQGADEGEILNVGVGRASRRRGLGRALVAAMLTRLAALGAATVYLEVRESNRPARSLYAQLGFQDIGRRRGYYRDPLEDAVMLKRDIPRG